MFSIQIEMDSANAQVRLEQMVKDIEDTATIAMPAVFEVWQVDDMKRDVPNTDIGGWAVTTTIWPTSRKKMIAKKRTKFGAPTRQARGLRRILRPELFALLRGRMASMLYTYCTWSRKIY